MGDILILPGIGNSGPQHWQSLWEASDARMRRVAQRDWDRPACEDWRAALEAAVAASGPRTLLVAHSLACLLVAHWAARTTRSVAGALLVAVPDPSGRSFPVEATGFGDVPMQSLKFPSVVVASSDDPYGPPDWAARCANAWGSRLVESGPKGHINAASGLGDWPEGRALLASLAPG